MFIIKLTSDGTITWSKRIGYDGNDAALGVQYYSSYVYVAAVSDSTGWTTSKTDMVVLRMDSTTGVIDYIQSIGGT